MIDASDKPYVLLNDFRAQWQAIRSESLKAIDEVGHSGRLILGDKVALFEEKLAAFSESSHAVGCANGLDAIEISLRALGLRPGEKVITTPLSAFATTLAIHRAGGVPLFVDVDESGLLDLDAVERLLLDRDAPPRFLLPVHLFGHAIDLARLKNIKERFELMVVEDCAQAILATSDGLPVGSIGDMSTLSLYPTKNLGALGDAGAILSNSQSLASVARALRDYGQTGKYRHTYLGMNSRLDELHASILVHSLMPRLSEATRRRREIAQFYRDNLTSSYLSIPPSPRESNSVYHLFPVLLEARREEFQRHMNACGIETAIHYPMPIPDQPALAHLDHERYGPLPITYRFANYEVSLPIHPYLSQEDVQRVSEACNAWNGR